QQPYGGIKAGVRNAPLPHAAVGFGAVVQQVLDGVVGVGAFVGSGFTGLSGQLGTHVFKRAFRHVAPPYILKGKDVALVQHRTAGADAQQVLARPIRPHPVGRALEQHRVAHLVSIVWRVHNSVKLRAITHRNLVFRLGKVLLNVKRVGQDFGQHLLVAHPLRVGRQHEALGAGGRGGQAEGEEEGGGFQHEKEVAYVQKNVRLITVGLTFFGG
nr:hypothetical protein [Tanacetum cinerariifolium]